MQRLVEPADDFVATFPGLNFRNRRSLVTHGEKILLVDPIYIADVYNSTDDVASFLRDRGLFLMDFGGDTAVPVWWKPPFLLMPISMHHEKLDAPSGAEVLAEEIGCDSGSFVFLPLSADMPCGVQSQVKEVLGENNAFALGLPPGHWTAFYEQFEAPQANMLGLYRNVVLKHSPSSRPEGEGRG
ncbi:MAG TPA: hypothetical protein PKD26_14115 [Pyrinomonadaceae bacterium]|nr:hypothetical protein [Pyrinomonadaceae bacterium]